MSELTPEPLGAGRVETRELDQEVRTSFLDYAMSVIVQPRAPGRARRAQAGASPRALRDARGRAAAEPPDPQVRARRRRRDGQLPPARRLGDLRRARPTRAAVLAALSAHRRPGVLRLGRRRSPGRHALHRVPALAHRDRAAARHRRRHRRLPAELRRVAARAVGAAGALPEPARQRLVGHRRRHGDEHSAAQPRRGRRRDRRDDRRPDDRRRAALEARQGP